MQAEEGCISRTFRCWGHYLQPLRNFRNSSLPFLQSANTVLALGLLLSASVDIVMYIEYTGYNNPVDGYAFFLFMAIIELLGMLIGLITFQVQHPYLIALWGGFLAFRAVCYGLLLAGIFLFEPSFVPKVWVIFSAANLLFGLLHIEFLYLYTKQYIKDRSSVRPAIEMEELQTEINHD